MTISLPATPLVPLGHALPAGPFAEAAPDVFYDDAELAVHRGRPWLHAHLRSRHGLVLTSTDVRSRPGAVAEAAGRDGAVSVPVSLLDRHALVIGATGSGKTRLSLHLLTERLRAGGSALVLDFKRDTVRQVLLCGERAGLSPLQVTLVWPGEDGVGVPGWNPFVGEASEMRQRIRQFVGLVRASADVAGTRMWDLLTNAATVVAGQGLSIVELLRFLQSPDYMAGLLREARHTPAWEAFEEAHLYFDLEFASLSKAERSGYVGPVLNKIRALVDIPYLKGMMGADRDTLDLAGLWKRPRLVAVHLDEYALGADGARLLAGMLAHSLYSLSARKPGKVGVTLMLDELASQERYLGAAVRDIVEKGRQQGLHLLCAGQHLEQISDELRKLLLSSCALRVFFRLGPDDAARAGRWMATGLGSRATRLALSVDKGGAWETWRHDLLDPWDQPIGLDAGEWATLASVQATCEYSPGVDLRRVPALGLLLAKKGIPRVYVRCPETGEAYELGAYVRGLPASVWVLLGPAPLRLLIRFPRPKVTVLGTRSEAERAGMITQALMEMPPQQAVVVMDTGQKAQVQTLPIHFPDDLPPVSRYLNRQEQTREEMRDTQRRRRDAIQALSAGLPAPNVGRTPYAEIPPAQGREGTEGQRTQARGRSGSGPPTLAEGARETPPAGKKAVGPKAAGQKTSKQEAGGENGAKGGSAPMAVKPEPAAPRVTRPEVEDDGTL